jgi:cell division protein FtsI/penicillin-binding protein 2
LGCVTVLPVAPSKADFTLFSGVDPKDQLGYSLDFGNRSASDRYRLRLAGNKLPLGTTEINIIYPEHYSGRFDDKQMEVRVDDKLIPVAKANWDKEKRTVQITLDKRLQTKQEIEIVLNNVQNPDSGGIFYFDCQIKSSAAFPLARYAGTWILSIN